MKKNWVYYMQEGLKAMWKKKEVPDYRREKNLAKLYNQEKVFKPIENLKGRLKNKQNEE